MAEKKTAAEIMQQVQSAKPTQVLQIEDVKNRYVKNYNATHREKVGDLVWMRNITHLQQLIMGSDALQKCDGFSIYAVLMTVAANGASLDPADNECYVIARGGKATLARQAGWYIRRLKRTEQIVYCQQAKIVYKGDDYDLKDGRIENHIERGLSDEMILGYVKMVIDETGKDIHFIYWKRDWKDWQKRSANPNTVVKKGQYGDYTSESLWDGGVVGGTQPDPGFIKTKIIKHAANEKCWGSGTTPMNVETFADVEVDAEDIVEEPKLPNSPPQTQLPAQTVPAPVPAPEPPKAEPHHPEPKPSLFTDVEEVQDDNFADEPLKNGVSFDDDNF